MRRWPLLLVILLCAALAVIAGCSDDDDEAAGGTTGTSTTAAADLGLRTPGVLLVGSDIPYAPFEYTEPGSNEVIGFDVDVVKAVAGKLGIEDVRFQKQAFDTIFTTTAQGRFDMAASSITINEERSRVVAFSDPYFTANQSVMVRADDASRFGGLEGTITPEQAREALRGTRLGVQRGTTGAQLALSVPEGDVQQFQLVDDAFNALAAGRVDAVVNDYAVSANATTSKRELRVLAKVNPSERYGFAFPPGNTALRDAFNRGLAEIRADGTYAEIYRRWFNEDPPAEDAEPGEGTDTGTPTDG
ncbi:MAG TPA: basic amino acid ABC transporter substrate-binding protein [Miltoncostaeaceae bacterium]|nr:basic amino acid ABC transporter substrate-binding protein [Miltoncostaeaceae bacterium]